MKGSVDFWNEEKGFGSIVGEDGKQYFVHISSVSDPARVERGAPVDFAPIDGDRGPTAGDVKVELRADDELVDLYSSPRPPRILVEAVQTITVELVSNLARHPEDLYEIKPRQFEELIAEVLASYGWQVDLTSTTRDGGYDLFATSSDVAGVQSSWIIECKRYRQDRSVGIEVARALYGVRDLVMPAGMLMLATTSFFSRGVQALKASRYDLELRDYAGIIEWLNEYRPHPSGRLYLRDNRLGLPSDKNHPT